MADHKTHPGLGVLGGVFGDLKRCDRSLGQFSLDLLHRIATPISLYDLGGKTAAAKSSGSGLLWPNSLGDFGAAGGEVRSGAGGIRVRESWA